MSRNRHMVSTRATQSSKRWFRYLLQPSWLAGIVSVGIHGVLFATGPTFSGLNFQAMAEPEQLPEEQRKVPVIELTAAEQQRLPDFSQSFYSFENFGSLEPADPFNPLLFEENIENSGIEQDASAPLTDNRSTYSLPIHSSPFESWLPTPGISLPPPTITIPETPSGSPPAEEEATPAESVEGEGSDEVVALNPAEDSSNSEANVPTEGTAADLVAPTPSPETSATEGDPPPPENLEEFLAQANDEEGELTPEAYPQAYVYSDTGTTEEEVSDRFEAWFLDGKAATGGQQIALFQPINLPLSYEPQYCLEQEPDEGLIGVLVDAEGKLLGDPELLRSTGYLFLNFEAVESVKAQNFPPVKRLSAYQFKVVVEYDPENCVPGLEAATSVDADTSSPSEASPKVEATTQERGTTSDTDRPGQETAPEPEPTEDPEADSDDADTVSE